MKKIIIAVLVLAVCFTKPANAQTTDASMKSWQDYMTPGDIHKMIARYDGTWNEDVTVWMQPGNPPSVSKSTAVNTMIMGGRYQESKISGNIMGMPFEGFSLLGYDNIKKVFTSTWVDNFGTGTMTMEGTWDDATKTIILKGKSLDPMSGKDMDEKETIQFINDSTEKFTMYTESAAGEFKNMEINSIRAK